MDTPPYIFDEIDDQYNDDHLLQLLSPTLSFSPPDTPLSFAEEEVDDWEDDWNRDINDHSLVLDCQHLTTEPFPIDMTTTDDLRSNLAGLGISVPDHHRNAMVAENLPPLPRNGSSNSLVSMDDSIIFQDTFYCQPAFPKKPDVQRHTSLRHSSHWSSSSSSTVTTRGMRRHSTTDNCA